MNILGLGDITSRLRPTELKFVSGALEIISIYCGLFYIIINSTDGLFVFGDNSCGQLGLGDREERRTPTKLKFEHEIISLEKRKQIKSCLSIF